MSMSPRARSISGRRGNGGGAGQGRRAFLDDNFSSRDPRVGGAPWWEPSTVVLRRCHGRVFMPDSLPGPRLRQVALVAHDCEKTATALQATFGWPDPFHDPGVGEFGLINAVQKTGNI